jgi:hypothetical protein
MAKAMPHRIKERKLKVVARGGTKLQNSLPPAKRFLRPQILYSHSVRWMNLSRIPDLAKNLGLRESLAENFGNNPRVIYMPLPELNITRLRGLSLGASGTHNTPTPM